MAYKSSQKDWLIVETIDGKEQPIKIPWEEDWYGFAGWLNNHDLEISIDGGLLVLNPFTGERRKLLDDFPDLAEPIGVGADWWEIAYNPSLTRAVFPSHPGYVNANGQYGEIILWNMETNQIVTSIASENNPYGGEPVWSPRGDEFIMALQDYDPAKESLIEELYRVSQDGQQTKITNLSTYYNKQLSLFKYSWSPDTTHIAFWLWYGWKEGLVKDQLAVLNLRTLQVTNYCIDGAGIGGHPVWSPDGKQLVVKARVDEGNLGTILIDMDRSLAIQVAGYFRPVGWMVAP
jgi:hypothetical protein